MITTIIMLYMYTRGLLGGSPRSTASAWCQYYAFIVSFIKLFYEHEEEEPYAVSAF